MGRNSELHQLRSKFDSGARLITVVGLGGTGKTRFACRYASTRLDDWPAGVCFCDLSEARSVGVIVTAVAVALGVQLVSADPSAQLAQAMRGNGRCLMILDNFEQVVEQAKDTVGAWLDATPACFLVTSREPLRIAGEQLFALDPLQSTGEGVDLFHLRARAVQPDFALDDTSTPEVEQIVRRLDGLPLAIELAAARVPLLGVAGISERLHERFRLLSAGPRGAPHRHRTLHEVLDWSYKLLCDEERTILRRIAVFAGSFSLRAAQLALADGDRDEWAVLDRLDTLLAKSLIAIESGEPRRYRLLENVRAYALERLRDAGERSQMERRHAEAIRRLFDEAYEKQWSAPESARFEQLVPDLDNLRSALDWAHEAGEAEPEVALAGASHWLWSGGGIIAEGQRRCALALQRVDAGTSPQIEARL